MSRRYWFTYWWTDNPWLCDGTGHPMTRSKYDHIRPCSLHDLAIERTGPLIYVCHVPKAVGAVRHHTYRILGRWALSILLGSPPLAIAQKYEVLSTMDLQKTPDLRQSYICVPIEPGVVRRVEETVRDKPYDGNMLKQKSHGTNWTVKGFTMTQWNIGTMSPPSSALNMTKALSSRLIHQSTAFLGMPHQT